MDARSFPPRSGWTNSLAHIRVLLLLAQQWTSSRLYSLWWSQFSFPFPEGLRLSLSRMASDPQSPEGSPESFFAEFINILNVFFCPVSAIFIPPESADTLSLKHGTDVVDFQHSHRSSDLLHRRVDPVLMESVKQRPAPVQSTHNLLLFLPSQKSLLRISS